MSEFKPFDFNGDLSPTTLRGFFKYCADHEVSDILIQGGDHIWVEIHGRQVKASMQSIQQGQLSTLISALWQSEVLSHVRAGRGADRPFELKGEEYGLPRGKALRFRCNFIQGRVGQMDEVFAITMRLIPSDLPNIINMNIEEELFENLYPDKGLVLVCGPTGSGKSTLLAGAYAYAGHRMPDRKVITYEDPIEFIYGGPHWKGPQPMQSQIGRDIENFAMGLKNAMRRKPSIIGIGEARDLETVDAMVEAGLTGHLCFATLHTESVAETINRIIQVYPPAQQSAIASRLIGCVRVIVVQRLLNTLDGKRRPVREFVVFDREMRNKLQTKHFEQWSLMLRQDLESRNATLDDRAWELYCEELIDQQTFVDLAGKQAFEFRIGGFNNVRQLGGLR